MRWDWLGHSYHRDIVSTGKQPILLLLVGLILGFAFIRTSTRLIRAQVTWWPGNVSAGGVHLHHEFFGVMIVLISGTLSFALTGIGGWHDVLAFTFGVGGGLVLDEFALLLHLQDVYWSKQGQASIDAVIAAVLLTAMLVVRVVPFGLGSYDSGEVTARWIAVSVLLLVLGLTFLCVIKGKPWLALFSAFVPIVGIVGSIRLAAAGSRWAHRFYPAGSRKATSAARRTRDWVAFKQRIVVAIGGRADSVVSPSDEPVRVR